MRMQQAGRAGEVAAAAKEVAIGQQRARATSTASARRPACVIVLVANFVLSQFMCR
jgi:hypothetical protein